MHVATDVRAEMFAVSREGHDARLADVFPEWTEKDRLGIVIREPFGSLGASLLLQLAALFHYEVRPERRELRPQYPHIYAFHVGGKFGDHSSFDIWPPRREVFVGDDSAELLGTINDRAITRLLVPDAVPHGADYVTTIPSGWTDMANFSENLTSAWAYATSGTAEGADIEVSSAAEELERMSTWALTPEDTFEHYGKFTGQQLVSEMQIGPSTASD